MTYKVLWVSGWRSFLVEGLKSLFTFEISFTIRLGLEDRHGGLGWTLKPPETAGRPFSLLAVPFLCVLASKVYWPTQVLIHFMRKTWGRKKASCLFPKSISSQQIPATVPGQYLPPEPAPLSHPLLLPQWEIWKAWAFLSPFWIRLGLCLNQGTAFPGCLLPTTWGISEISPWQNLNVTSINHTDKPQTSPGQSSHLGRIQSGIN